MVRVLAQEGSWLQIATWLGARWIYLQPPQPGEWLIALTFDDGPSTYTELLLDALAERGVPATFFVLGWRVTANPEIARRIVDEGHEIAFHGYTHRQFTRLGAAGIRDQLSRSRDVIYATTGATPTILRPPYGARNATVQSVAAEWGLPIVLWTVDTRDWETRNVDAILGHFVDPYGAVRIRPGDNILMHDIYPTTIEAAIYALDLLLARGFTFVTVSDLLTERHGTLTPGGVYR